MSPLTIQLHTWRLRRVRRAFATLNRRLAAYEAAYGLAALHPTGEDHGNAGHTGISIQSTPRG